MVSNEQERYSPAIAVELTYQLETWYNHLPPSISFERYDMSGVLLDDSVKNISPLPPSSITAVSGFLQMQYYLCLTNIYWPAVYSTVSTGILEAALTADCVLFFESYCGFVISAASVVPNCPQNPWSIYAK
jgi:hypothetical protein